MADLTSLERRIRELETKQGNAKGEYGTVEQRLNAGGLVLCNYSGTTAPTTSDDSGDGYSIGSRWIDVTNGNEYVCRDATVGAALWLQTTSQAFPIGAVYTNTTGVNPATELGYGSWEAFSAGKVLVGLDPNDTDFDTVEETGGAKTHTLTEAEIPAHVHEARIASGDLESTTYAQARQGGTYSTPTWGSTGGGGSHNNVQPYIVVYFWKRIAPDATGSPMGMLLTLTYAA